MKKTKVIVLTTTLCMLLSIRPLHAENMDVTIASGAENQESEQISVDDIQLEKAIEITDCGIFLPQRFEFVDSFEQEAQPSAVYNKTYESGAEAEYAMLYMDITNLKTTAQEYLSKSKVSVLFDEKYEYEGWSYQQNYDINNGDQIVILPDHIFAIEPMYVGHYVFGCTLPNAVIESKAPLKMKIEIDENAFIYNIRK